MGVSGCASTPTAKQQTCPVTKEEVAEVQRQAEAGDAEAQRQLAGWYSVGYCLPKDQIKETIQRAAEQGHLEAQYRLGRLHSIGRGVSLNYTQAAIWYRRAAEQGHTRAQLRLGNLYYKGAGVQKDLDQAEYWYRKAAEQGDGLAKQRLLKVIKEQDPEAWKREQARLAEAEAEKKQRAEAARREMAQERFGTIALVVKPMDDPPIEMEQRPHKKVYNQSCDPGHVDAFLGFVFQAAIWIDCVRDRKQKTREAAKITASAANELKDAAPALEAVFRETNVEERLRDQVISVATQRLNNSVLSVDLRSVEAEGQPDLAEQRIDTILELTPLTTNFTVSGSNVRLAAATKYRLIRAADNALIDEQEFHHTGPSAQVAEWTADNARAFREALETGCDKLAQKIVSGLLELAEKSLEVDS